MTKEFTNQPRPQRRNDFYEVSLLKASMNDRITPIVRNVLTLERKRDVEGEHSKEFSRFSRLKHFLFLIKL